MSNRQSGAELARRASWVADEMSCDGTAQLPSIDELAERDSVDLMQLRSQVDGRLAELKIRITAATTEAYGGGRRLPQHVFSALHRARAWYARYAQLIQPAIRLARRCEDEERREDEGGGRGALGMFFEELSLLAGQGVANETTKQEEPVRKAARVAHNNALFVSAAEKTLSAETCRAIWEEARRGR